MANKRFSETFAEVSIPITPMLDMTFLLLVFFLVTYKPPTAKEGQMDLNLPAETEAAAQVPEEVDPKAEHEEEIEDKAIVTVLLRGYKDTRNRGLISYMTVSVDSGGDEEIKGTREEREKALAEQLARVKPENNGKNTAVVRMAAESDVRWEEVMKVMDVCFKAGYQVSFIKPPDLGN